MMIFACCCSILALSTFSLRFTKSFRTMNSSVRRETSSMFARIRAEDVLKNPQFPEKWPFSPNDFKRQDESSDKSFYVQPRLVYHIDDAAVGALTRYYRSVLYEGANVLDICSSWVSHYPIDLRLGKRVGVGMNEFELSKNVQLDEYVVRDLNVDPILPFADNTFDFVTCVVSVDYLTRPLEIFSEIRRVLKPNGTCIISQSNRCFPTKAIDIWLNTNDLQHIYIIGCYFHYAGGFNPPESLDISPRPGLTDPLYIIKASKKSV